VNYIKQAKIKIVYPKFAFIDDELEGVWHKTDLKVRDGTFPETIDLNTFFNDPDSFNEMVIAVISHELLQTSLLSTTVRMLTNGRYYLNC
jgi:hypothetical protein